MLSAWQSMGGVLTMSSVQLSIGHEICSTKCRTISTKKEEKDTDLRIWSCGSDNVHLKGP